MAVTVFTNATLVLPDRLVPNGVASWSRTGGSRAVGDAPREPAERSTSAGCTSRRGSSTCTSTAATGPTSWTARRRRSAPCAAATPPRHDEPHADQHRRDRGRSTTRSSNSAANCTATCPAARGSSAATSTARTSPARRAGATRTRSSSIPTRRTRTRFTKLAEKMPLVVTVAPEIENAEWLVRDLRATRRAVQRRAQPRDVRAGGGRGAVGRAARRSPVLRDVRPRPAAAVADVPDARRRDGSDALLRRTDHRGDRRRQAPRRRNCCGSRTR